MSHPAIALCLEGSISPAVALARLVLDGIDPDAIAAMLPPTGDLPALFAAQRGNIGRLTRMLRDSEADHAPLAGDAGLVAIAAMFDRAVATSPEASVAAYSLGDRALLAAATDEIVEWLRRGDMIAATSAVLDFGCGFGRIAGALAPLVGSVVGVDVSAGMIAEARRRYRSANLRFEHIDGNPMSATIEAGLDLVLAVDSMPYLVQVGMARDHVRSWRRLLRPGGRVIVLNLSYRGDPAADLADMMDWAQTFGFVVEMCGERPFRLWDGAAFALRVAI